MPKLKKDAVQKTIKLLRAWLAIIAVAVTVMSLYHFKVFSGGTPNVGAGMAEAIICAALVAAFIVSGEGKRKPRDAIKPIYSSLMFSLLLTMLGMSIILLTFAPALVVDLCFHIFLAAALAFGLIVSGRVKQQL